jgi:hypothetical protein
MFLFFFIFIILFSNVSFQENVCDANGNCKNDDDHSSSSFSDKTKQLKTILESKPNDIEVLYSYAVSLFHDGQQLKAAEILEQILTFNPTIAQVYFILFIFS